MVIELKGITKFYGKLKAVDNLSLSVTKGEVYGFLGPNGSGKSTTIRMILSLIRPSSGTIRLFGSDVIFGRNYSLSRIGALIETPDFYNYLSARKNLEILGKLSGEEPLARRIDEVLDIVGLTNRSHSRVRTFSKGMKQRLGIAQALLHEPELIILDEPTNGLDPQGQKEIRSLVETLKENQNITILISSHLLFEIEQMASRMVIINKGRAIVEGSVGELIRGREQRISINAENPELTLDIINHSDWSKKLIATEDKRFSFFITKEEIPGLTAYLSAMGSLIFSIEPIRSLEDYFLQITENETID